MTKDIRPMGPHALASRHSRAMAMKSFGVDPMALSNYRDEERSLARQSRSKRALMIQEEHAIMIQDDGNLPMIL